MTHFSPRGVFTALITPFTKGGDSIDEDSLRRLISYQLDAGISGVVVVGSTGEGQTLTDKEAIEVATMTREVVAGKCPIIGGIGTSSTRAAVNRAKEYKNLGLDALLLVAPPYNKPSQQGIMRHYISVKEATDLPLIAYNIPGRTCCNMFPATVGALSSEGVICAIKEASGSLDQIIDTILAVDGKAEVLAGDDSYFLPMLSVGGGGVISASANLAPRMFVEIWKAFERGDYSTTLKIHKKLIPVIRALFLETNPVPVKSALQLKSIISNATVREPLLVATNETTNRLREIIEQAE